MKPTTRPKNPQFSSGPTAKRPGWSVDVLKSAVIGRSHRSKLGKARLEEVINKSRQLLGLPDDYLIGIVPGSDTGAFEMALWTMLGERGVDILAWESFGSGWVTDVVKQLKIADLRKFECGYGQIPDLSAVDCDRDVIFTWNGTTSGVKVPNGDWIKADRKGLTFVDATSAVFAMYIPWDKVDVLTYSWQKVLGGEAAHGMLVLSPRAVARLESYTPSWPLPKVFRLTKGGKVEKGVFKGETINTPSMICVEDALDSLVWAEQVGGLKGLIARSNANFAAIENWVKTSNWAGFLADDPAIRSNTSVCLKIVDPWFTGKDDDAQQAVSKEIVALLEKEGAAQDLGAYRDAPAGLRIWCGATVETADVEALLPWLDWAYGEVKAKSSQAA